MSDIRDFIRIIESASSSSFMLDPAGSREVKQFVADGDAQGLQNMFFGFPSIKNQMHVKLKKMADPKDFDHDRAVGTWGNINLAIDILGTLF